MRAFRCNSSVAVAGEQLQRVCQAGGDARALLRLAPPATLATATDTENPAGAEEPGGPVEGTNVHADHLSWYSPRSVTFLTIWHGSVSAVPVLVYALLSKGGGGGLKKLRADNFCNEPRRRSVKNLSRSRSVRTAARRSQSQMMTVAMMLPPTPQVCAVTSTRRAHVGRRSRAHLTSWLPHSDISSCKTGCRLRCLQTAPPTSVAVVQPLTHCWNCAGR